MFFLVLFPIIISISNCIEYCNEDTFTADCSQFNPDQQNSAQQHNLQQLYLQYDQQFQQQPHFSLPYNYDQHKQINKQNALQQHYVILIKNALYGRMKVGECVKKGMGYVGCFSNITSALHRKCSGLKYCFLRVNDETLQLNQPCDYELKNYLDVDYTCIPVVSKDVQPQAADSINACTVYISSNNSHKLYLSPLQTQQLNILQQQHQQHYQQQHLPKHLQQHQAPLNLPQQQGNKCGTSTHPWVFMARQGQAIKSSIMIFHQNASKANNHFTNVSGDKFVAIEESSSSSSSSSSFSSAHFLSGNDSHSSHISTTAHLSMVLLKPFTENNHYLVTVQAFGCPDKPEIENSQVASVTEEYSESLRTERIWYKRVNDSAMVVGCLEGSSEWWVTCKGGGWHGEWKDCSIVVMKSSKLFGFGAGVLLVISLSVFVGVLIMIVGLQFIKRKKDRCRRSAVFHDEKLICSSPSKSNVVKNNKNKKSKDYEYMWKSASTKRQPITSNPLNNQPLSLKKNQIGNSQFNHPGSQLNFLINERAAFLSGDETTTTLDKSLSCTHVINTPTNNTPICCDCGSFEQNIDGTNKQSKDLVINQNNCNSNCFQTRLLNNPNATFPKCSPTSSPAGESTPQMNQRNFLTMAYPACEKCRQFENPTQAFATTPQKKLFEPNSEKLSRKTLNTTFINTNTITNNMASFGSNNCPCCMDLRRKHQQKQLQEQQRRLYQVSNKERIPPQLPPPKKYYPIRTPQLTPKLSNNNVINNDEEDKIKKDSNNEDIPPVLYPRKNKT